MRTLAFDMPVKSIDRYSQPGTPIASTNDNIQLLFILTDITADELTGAQASVYIHAEDKGKAGNTPIITGNTVTYTLTDAECHQAGTVSFDLAIDFADNKRLNSQKISITIIESLKDKINREMIAND